MASQSFKTTGLAFSGGGVRSAAFCSGVLRRLLQKGVAIDHLSSVSGGGYTGTSYMDWKFRNGKKDDPAWHKKYFEHLRKHINPLCDCFNPLRGIVDGAVFGLIVLLISIGVSLMRAFSFAIPITFIVDYLFGNILRDQFTCGEANSNKTVEGIPKNKLIKLCIPKFGPKMEVMLEITFPMFAAYVVLYYLNTLVQRRTVKYLLKFLYRLSGFGFAMVFLPWFLETYRTFTPPWANYSLIILVLVIWLFFPSLRETAFYSMIILVYAYCVRWTVFKTPLAGVGYTDELYWILVWVSAFLMWIHPYLGTLQMNGVHLYVEWRLMRTYFSSESKMASLFCNFTKNQPLTLADLVDMKPEYKCNTTVNQWRKTDSKSEKDYEVLTFSPNNIERIDQGREETGFRSEEFLKPNEIRLSSAMTTSASAMSYDEGDLQNGTKAFREIKVILALGFGNNLVAQTGLTKSWMSWVVTLIIQVIFGLTAIAIPVALYVGAIEDWTFWGRILMAFLIAFFVLLGFIAILPIDGKGFCSTFIRWCIINILHVRILRTLFDITDVGSLPPPVLALSDGGHAENLGLLPLFKLRLQRIVTVNGGALLPGDSYASDLLKTLQKAREKLRCSFTGISGRDINEDIRDHFVEKEKGEQPRSYRFKVQYYEKDVFEKKLVGEGEVMMLMPRHPDDGISQFQDWKWSDFDGDVKLDLDGSVWGPGPALKTSEVNRLSGCCFECCHSKPFNYILNSLMDGFPFHSTVNQMFTPSQFSAYHREGYHASLEGEADRFLGKYQNVEVVTRQPQGSVTPTVINVRESEEFLPNDHTKRDETAFQLPF